MTMTPPVRDRRQILEQLGATFNGIDYVDVSASDQTQLYVHFINGVTVAGTLTGTQPVTITGGEVISTVAVGPIAASDFSADSEGRPVLALSVNAPGDFSTYTLSISSTVLDPFFSTVPFSFKAGCPTLLDCAPAPVLCPPDDEPAVTIDYLAKDFASFCQALREFSAVRYPGWLETSEADLGATLMEAMAALGDELSYLQDRVSFEAAISTATQRRSVVNLARLVDYEPMPATVATGLVQLDVQSIGPITTPIHCQAVGPDGSTVDFEVGSGLADPTTGAQATINFPVDPRWNRFVSGGAPGTLNLPPYWWDDSTRCLETGSTQLYILGHGHALYGGQQLLLDTAPDTSADPPIREVVTISSDPQSLPFETTDPVLSNEVTLVTLAAQTTLDHDLFVTEIAGNLVPVTQGLRQYEWFYIPGATPTPGPVTPTEGLVRLGANSTPDNPNPDYFYCLAQGPLAWISTGKPDPSGDQDVTVPALPEVVLTEQPADSPWLFARWLLDAGQTDSAFTLAPEQYSPVLTVGDQTWYDYDGDAGTTIHFGDGTFGMPPVPGNTFQVIYRIGGGEIGNVPAGTITRVVPGQPQSSIVITCTNPFPATGGTAAETLAQVANRAPVKFSVDPLRVVKPRDYIAAAQSLPFVQQAGTTFRWTGSWLTALTTANPVGEELPTVSQLETVTELLDRRRLAGYESYVIPPRYVSVDLQMVVCAESSMFNADVYELVVERLRPGTNADGMIGFFDHSNWSFGQPLESATLLAAVQSLPGVAGVFSVQYRQRGVQLDWVELPETLSFAADQVLRIDDDPSRPEAGSLSITVKGGK